MVKFVIWYNEETKTVQIFKRFNEDTEYNHPILKKRISIVRFIWYWLSDKRFKWNIESAIQYSIIHANTYLGNLASDLVIAESNKHFFDIWRIK